MLVSRRVIGAAPGGQRWTAGRRGLVSSRPMVGAKGVVASHLSQAVCRTRSSATPTRFVAVDASGDDRGQVVDVGEVPDDLVVGAQPIGAAVTPDETLTLAYFGCS